jgi:hypothetical protein
MTEIARLDRRFCQDDEWVITDIEQTQRPTGGT